MNEAQAVHVKNEAKTTLSLRASRYQDPLLTRQLLNSATVIYA